MIVSNQSSDKSAVSADTGKLALHTAELISDIGTPVSIYEKLARQSAYAFLLESAEGDTRLARYSFVGVDPLVTISLKSGVATLDYIESNQSNSIPFTDPLSVLRSVLDEYRARLADSAVQVAPFPFSGGLVGYMGFGAVQYFEGIPMQEFDPHNVPDGIYGLYDSLVVFDHQFRRINVLSRRGPAHVADLVARITTDDSQLEPLRLDSLSVDGDADLYNDVTTSVTREKYLDQVEECKELIRAGEVFQIVLAQRFSLPVTTTSLNLYRVLQAVNPSPYAYLLKYPGFDYIGSSPETFVRCTNGEVMLRAIAGTRPRGKTVAADKAYESELRSSEKENAEHMMLVDLGRNDLGRISEVGSITVGEIAMLTKYAHVMHLATEITGRLAEGKTTFDAFRSCFPRGTVSGAPKIRAMRHLARLEPEQRGVYSGVVGYFGLDGNMDGAIAIRSALIKDSRASVTAGAGIVLDSDPQGEYEETQNKARSLIKAIKAANAISASNKKMEA